MTDPREDTSSGASEASRAVDPRSAVALVYCAVVLSAMEYFFLTARVLRGDWMFSSWIASFTRSERDFPASLVWVASTVVFFLVVPVLIVRLWHREPLSSVGFGFKGFIRHVWVYLGLYALMVPVLLLVSKRPDFGATYPFVARARTDLSVFIRWEAAYLLQFVALEAFFRGYLLFTLARRFGPTAIAVMVVPYTMIHFHKPPLECFAAVAAGLLLGWLALRFRSFWGGALLHGLVASTMDWLAAGPLLRR